MKRPEQHSPAALRPSRLLAAAALAASLPAAAIEEPSYTVLQQRPSFELREYAPYMVAEVRHPGPREQADRDAFRLLFGYISGRNRGQRRIEMTAPVTSERQPVKIEMTAPVASVAADGGYVVQFVLPARFTPDNTPEPDDARVKVREVPAQQVAVARWRGRWTDANIDDELTRLREAVAAAGLRTIGEPVLSRYDPPFMPPFLRRNEIWLRVEP